MELLNLMSLVTMQISDHIFDHECLEPIIKLLNQPFLDVESMIRVHIQQVYFDLVSIYDPDCSFELTSVTDIDHLDFVRVDRSEELQFPYNKIINSFPKEVIDVFILKFYFAVPHKTITGLLLFIGLNREGTIISVKELCWNTETHQIFELRTMFFSFSIYIRVPEEKSSLPIAQAS